MLFGKPLNKRTAGVEREFEAVVPLKNFEEGEITLLVRLFQDVSEVSDGLMVMQGENEANSVHLGGIFGRYCKTLPANRQNQPISSILAIILSVVWYSVTKAKKRFC